jgi:hypothetical protein
MELRLVLEHAQHRLAARLAQVEARIAAGDEGAWPEYRELAVAIATVATQVVPGVRGELLTTKQLAERLQVAPKTILRRAKRGELAGVVRFGARGRGALRFDSRGAAR